MIEALEIAVAKLGDLPEDRQAYVAKLLEEFVGESQAPFKVPPEHRAGLRRGVAQLERGEFASDEAVEAVFGRTWK